MSGAEIQSATRTIDFAAELFRPLAIQKAAYRFAARCSVQLEALADRRIRAVLTARGSDSELTAIAEQFRIEVLDQELREAVADETRRVRDLLLAQAFLATSLVDPVGESADYAQDPLGIAAWSHLGDHPDSAPDEP